VKTKERYQEQSFSLCVPADMPLDRIITLVKVGGYFPQLPHFTRKVKLTIIVEDLTIGPSS
jgi:hypothetical protein